MRSPLLWRSIGKHEVAGRPEADPAIPFQPSALRSAFTFALTALLCAVTAPRVHAQTEESTNAWVTSSLEASIEGEVHELQLNIEEGEGLSYRIRLTKRLPFVNPDDPTEGRVGGWWVRVHVDGEVRADGYYDDID